MLVDYTRYKRLFFSPRVPLLQNRVYSTRESATAAQSASIDIVFDRQVGYAINAAFQSELATYDSGYDNSVPSPQFMAYYDALADYLVCKYDLSQGKVYDIGCGKGTFLWRTAARYEEVRGVGIDPSYCGPESAFSGRLVFINERFCRRHIVENDIPSILICRHVIEHIKRPEYFLSSIFDSVRGGKQRVPVFIEVPDFNWIVQNNAFWDLCYEHVNYFTPDALSRCITRAGAQVTRVTTAFGGQYIWAEANLNPRDRSGGEVLPPDGTYELDRDIDFEAHLNACIQRVRQVASTHQIVIWGMATKGVMLSLHLLNAGLKVNYCVDINSQKQGKYTPVSGLEIIPPEELPQNKNYAVFCMNPNYMEEVEAACRALQIRGDIFDPTGQKMRALQS